MSSRTNEYVSLHNSTVWNQSDEKWYFVVTDVIQVLTDTPNPSDYIKKMRKRDEELSKGWGQFVTPLSVVTTGGKQKLNCASAKGLRDYPLISIEAAPPYSVSMHNNDMPPIPELS